MPQRTQCREKTNARPAVFQPQVRLRCWRATATAFNPHGSISRRLLDLQPQSLQTVDHDLSVTAVQDSGQQ